MRVPVLSALRSFSLAALGAVALLLSASSSQSGTIGLPNNLGALLGNTTTVGPDAFSFIAYCNTADGNPIAAASVNVTALSGNPSGSLSPFGFELIAPFAAIPNTVNLNVFLFRSLSVSFCDNSSFT
jgi:hypothetical protein